MRTGFVQTILLAIQNPAYGKGFPGNPHLVMSKVRQAVVRVRILSENRLKNVPLTEAAAFPYACVFFQDDIPDEVRVIP